MKKILFYSFIFLVAGMQSSCIKNELKLYKGPDVVEFDAAVLNSPAVGVTFPLLTRMPAYGLAVSTSNPLITRASGTVKFRINLVGNQSSTEQTIKYKVVTTDFSSSLDIPSGAGSRLPAVAGTHFNTTGTVVIPAKSSYGEVEVQIINPGTSSSTARYLVLELEGNGSIKPSENFKRLGIQISQS